MVGHRIVLTGGGTGGHIYPALSVAEHLKDDPSVEAILYRNLSYPEEKLARDNGLDFIGLNVSGMPRSLSPRLITWPFQMWSAIERAKEVLRQFKPTVVLGTGGYASAPPLAAANSLGVPTAVHEPDAHPGLVNCLPSRRAQLVSLGMQGAAGPLMPHVVALFLMVTRCARVLAERHRDSGCAILGLRLASPNCLKSSWWLTGRQGF